MPDETKEPASEPPSGASQEPDSSSADPSKMEGADILDELIREFSSDKPSEPMVPTSPPPDLVLPSPPVSEGPSLAQLRMELAHIRSEFDKLQTAEAHLKAEHERTTSELKAVREQEARAREQFAKELEEERGLRVTVEKSRDEVRAELTKTLEELSHHRSSSKTTSDLQAHLEEAQRELREREASLASLSARDVQTASELTEARARAETLSMEARTFQSQAEEAKAEVASLRDEVARLSQELDNSRQEMEAARSGASASPPPGLEEAKAELEGLRGELGRLTSDLEKARRDLDLAKNAGPASTAPSEGGKPIPAAPVAFLGTDGATIAQQSLFALGKGEALESFLSVLLRQWKAMPFPMTSVAASDGVVISLRGDPEKRSIRILPSGIYLIKLAPAELKSLGTIPKLVSKKSSAPPAQP